MTTLADKSLLSGGDNKPPMLEKHLYDSWKSRMELYMMNRPHGRMILASVEKGPLVWPSITEDGVTRLKEYVELTPAEAIQADCDIKAINIILQGLPTEIYALVSQHRVANDLWEKIQLLMQGTSLTKQERECKLYDEFDKFTYKKGETLHEYYLRFTLLLNDMNIYKMPLEQFQVNTKFLNTLSFSCLSGNNPERPWQNEVRLMHERNSDPLALVASHQLTQPAYQSHLHTHPKSLSQLQCFTISVFTYQSTVHHNVYSSQPSIPQVEYAPIACQQQHLEFFQPDSGLVVPVFQKGDDPIDAINHMMSFLTAVVISRKGYKLLMQLNNEKKTRPGTMEATTGKQRTVQAIGNALTEEEIAFLADPDFQTFKNLSTIALMANLSRNGSDALTEVHNPDNLTYDLFNQNEQIMTSSEQSNDETVPNSNSSAQQDVADIIYKVWESKPKQYDRNVILKMDTIVIPDFDETLMLCEESHSKMLLKEQDPMVVKNNVNTKPINYVVLNNDYNKQFVRQSDLYSEHAYWKATSVPPLDPSPSSTTNKVEVPKELPKVSMVNTSLKELKRHLAGFDQVVKERTTATAITEGTWGFEHTKACFRDEIIPFIKELKDIFNNFNQYLVDELADVQNVFYQMEQAVEQHFLEFKTFEVKMNQVLSENERLLAQAIDHDIVKTVMNLSVNDGCETVNECQKCLELKTELLNKKDVVDKETYDKLCKSFTTLEKHCITLEADSQLNQEIFQQKNSVLDQNAPSFTQLFELSELRAQSQEKDTVIVKLKEQIKSLKGNVDDSKVKMDMDKIETLNIELEHRVTKLVAENEHLKQTYKQLYDSIKPKRVQSKEQCDALIKQVNIKSGEISDLNAKLQEQVCPEQALKNELRKLKGKALDKEAIETHSVDPKVSKDNVEPITPKLLNKRTAHSSYIKHTQEEAFSPALGVRLSTSASGSQPSGNTRNDKIQQTPSSNSKNKVEAHPRNVKSSLNKRNGTVKVNGSASVQNSKKHDNSDYVCINGDDCMSSDNLCVSNSNDE
ncbi:hypothetical protein Tco_1474213 [Tanacetum coccineum]